MQYVKSWFTRLIVTIVSFLLVVSLSKSVLSVWRKRDIVHERERALQEAQEENDQLQKDLENVQSQEYIERIARDKLGLIKEGEKIVLLPRTQNTDLPADKAGPSDQIKPEELPNWKQWWKLFF